MFDGRQATNRGRAYQTLQMRAKGADLVCRYLWNAAKHFLVDSGRRLEHEGFHSIAQGFAWV